MTRPGCAADVRPADLTPEAWWPTSATLSNENWQALDVCWQRCRMRRQCEAAILGRPVSERYGIWGGKYYEPNLSRRERAG